MLTAPARGYVIQGLQNLQIEYKHFNVNFSELPKLYNCLDVYLISSRDEGGPTGMFEAMACGIPVVSTKVGQAFDSIIDGQTGFVAEVGDFNKLSQSIEIIYNNILLKKKMSTLGVIEAKKHSSSKHKILWRGFFDILTENKNFL